MTLQVDFKFSRYTPRRAARGVEAVEVIVTENGEDDYLWMSAADIKKNMMIFGEQPELKLALSYYDARHSGRDCRNPEAKDG